MVREGDPAAVEGTLSIEDAILTFEPATEGAQRVSIPKASIRKVRRGRGGPLLSLSYLGTEGVRKLFFYFAKPPPLPGTGPAVPSPMLRWGRGLERSAAALALGAGKRLFKREIEAWVSVLREPGG